MITQQQAKRILNIALSTGGDFAELFFEEKISEGIVKREENTIDEASTTEICGVGLRILKDLQGVNGYTNDISNNGLTRLAKDLSKSFNHKRVKSVEDFKISENKGFKCQKTKVSNAYKTRLVNKVYKACKGKNRLISKVTISLVNNDQKVTIINSDGLWITDRRFRVRMGIMAVAAKDNKMETAFEGPGASKGFEYFDEIDIKQIAKNVAKSAMISLKAVECPSAKMDVVIENGFGGVIFHEACGHSLEATSIAKGLSVFCGKKGEKIANDIVTAVDDGTIEHAWGSATIDDEGNKTQKTILIKNGVLTNYLVDRQNGRRMKEHANGCCRRQNYKYAPTSRMSNTYITPGNSTVEEMISATKKGLYAKKMGGGSVNPITGEFNFSVSEGYLIENGKITKPVKGASLVGKGNEVLFNIDMIGKNLERAQGMCGSSSGSIPVDVGQPAIRVKNITVGGRG